MTEYIERERLIGSLEDVIADYRDEHTFSTDFAATVVIDILNNIVKCQPAADVEPVKWGRWIMGTGENGFQTGYRKCSRCGEIVKYGYSLYGVHNFCNYCGAKMNEEEHLPKQPKGE